MSNYKDPSDIRDKGLQFLQKGKEYFNKNSPDARAQGYDIFKRGLGFIIEYLKVETNTTITAKLRENLKVWMNEAKSMEATVHQAPSSTNSQNHRQNTNNNTNQSIRQPVNQPAMPPMNQPFDLGIAPMDYRPPQNQRVPTPPKKEPAKIKEGDKDTSKFMSNLEGAIVTEKPNVRWDDIAGLEQAKKSLQEAVIYPIKFPNLFEGMRTPWKGILLYGPPGTGKTYLAKACATEADATFFSVSSADITSKYVGESEKLIKTLFSMAREKKPAIIFIDEIDSLLSARSDNENEASRRVKTEFLVQMQGVGKDDTGILVLGATNIPWQLDSAVRRRFEKRIYIPLPDYTARLALLRKQMTQTPNSLTEDDVVYLAERAEGYSCADMNILIRDASYQPLRKAQNATHFKVISTLSSGKPMYEPCPPSHPQGQRLEMLDIPGDQLTLPVIGMDDFEISLLKTKPSVNQADLKKQEEFTKEFGIEG